MKLTRFKALVAAVLSVSMFAMPVVSFAEESDETYEKQYTDIQIKDGNYTFTDYEKEIEVDGVKYVFYSITYDENTMEKLEYKPEGEEKVYIEVIKNNEGNEVELGDEMPEVPETYTDDEGNVYKLVSTEWSEETVVDGRKADVTLYAERNSTKNGDAPAQMEAQNYIDPDTNNEKELPEELKGQMLDLKDSELKKEGWGIGEYQATMIFNNYEYTAFEYHGVVIQRDVNQPLPAEYWQWTIQDQGLDTSLFRVTNIAWAGEAYTDGTTYYRNAAITGDVYNKEYTDTYVGRIDVPAISYRTVVAVYEETDESLELRKLREGTATAIVTYKKAAEEETSSESESETKNEIKLPDIIDKSAFEKFIEFLSTPLVYTTIGVLALAIASVTILMIVAGKKKKKKEDGEGKQ